ncbi:MAG: hypothetical protein Q7W54_06465, partial [Bacteroidota bacterium]|nr:hypothetical protein [Bacteroidota bacterium]
MKFFSQLFLMVAVLLTQSTHAQNKTAFLDCSAKLENGELTLENSKILRTYQWNDGNIISSSLTD